MKLGQTLVFFLFLLLFATAPAFSQRLDAGIDVGESTDRFSNLPKHTGVIFDAHGQFDILKGNPKNQTPAIVAGAEAILPQDTQNHAKEYAIFGGVMFRPRNFEIGFHAQIRKLVLPPSFVDNQFFVRGSMEFVEIPLVLKYKFGTGRHFFIEAQGAPEFRPRYHPPVGYLLPKPNLDHGYFIRGSVGYNFGKWYAKATYQTRYLKFNPDPGNPNGLYNWSTNAATGGVGVTF